MRRLSASTRPQYDLYMDVPHLRGRHCQDVLAMRAPRKLVKEYFDAQKLEEEPALDSSRLFQSPNSSTIQTVSTRPWYSIIESTTIYPLFLSPRVHEGPCSDEIYSCIQNGLCLWSDEEPQLCSGCDCCGPCGRTGTCFKAKRECDSDLCKRCLTYSDPPGELAARQTCRHEILRHCRVVFGPIVRIFLLCLYSK